MSKGRETETPTQHKDSRVSKKKKKETNGSSVLLIGFLLTERV